MHAIQRRALKNGAIAGLAGGAAMAANILIDLPLTRGVANDFRLLGQVGPLRRHWRITGPLIHMGNAVALGAVYSVVEPYLKGNGSVRGMTFGMAENMGLWPLVLLLDHIHPAIQEGDLSRYGAPFPFTIEVIRHLSYGAALGYVYELLTKRDAASVGG